MRPLTSDQRDMLSGRPLYVSVSGGKDSTALALWLRENEVPFSSIFCDTGWEHPWTYQFLEQISLVIGPITTLRSEKAFDGVTLNGDIRSSDPFDLGGLPALAIKQNFLPRGAARWCTRDLKVAPVLEYLTSQRVLFKSKPINAVGIRAEESSTRALMSDVEELDEATTWRPLLTWSERDIIEMHSRHGVKPNPLYLRGASRVGCYPCIYARKSEIKQIAQHDPWRIDQIREIERRISQARQKPVSFFGARIKAHAPVMPIDDIVDWARGSTPDMFEDMPEEQGCMRWGLCEAAPVSDAREGSTAHVDKVDTPAP